MRQETFQKKLGNIKALLAMKEELPEEIYDSMLKQISQ